VDGSTGYRFRTSISDLRIVRTGSVGPAWEFRGGGLLTGAARWTATNVRVESSTGDALKIDGSYIGSFHSCYLLRAVGYGLNVCLDPTTGVVSGNALNFFGGEIQACTNAAFLDSSLCVNFFGTTFENSASTGIELYRNCQNVTFTGCYFEGNAGYDIKVGTSANAGIGPIITGSYFTDAGIGKTRSIHLIRASQAQITGNQFKGLAANPPILVEEATPGSVTGFAQNNTTDGTVDVTPLNSAAKFVRYAYAQKAADVAQPFLALVKAAAVDPVILVIGDSTSITSRWPTYLASNLAAMFPTHTVLFHAFDTTGPLSYLAPTTTSTGTGPRTIHVYNASIGGHNCNAFKGAKADGAFSGIQPDLTFLSMGHNEGVNSYWWHGQYLALTEELAQRHTGTIVSVSQNPTFVDPGTGGTTTDPLTGVSDGLQEARREVYRRIAARRGYGFIDATQAWLDSGHCVDWTSDGTHPITVGSQFWANIVCGMFVWDQNSIPRTQTPSLFSHHGANLLRNSTFADGMDYWTLSSITNAVDTVNFEGSSNTATSPAAFTATSQKITSLAGGNNFISQRVPVERVKGKWVTLAVRQFVPSTPTDAAGAGVIQIQDSVSTLGTTQNVGVTNGKDGWRWDVFSKFIDPAATYCIAKIFVNSGDLAGANLTVDRVVMVEGLWPADVARRELLAVDAWQSYTPTLSSNISIGNGTIVSTYRNDIKNGTVDFFARITFGSTTTINGSVATTVSLPVNILTSPSAVIAVRATLKGAAYYLGLAIAATTSALTVASIGTAGIRADLTAAVPFTWATGHIIEVSARYRTV